MLMMVVLHVNSHGNVLSHSVGYEHYIALFFECLCIVGVNVFVLISGYFLVEQSFRPSKLVLLVAEVCFYSWIIYGLLLITGKASLKSTDTISALFPLSFRQYWFVSVYFFLYLFSPLLNKLIAILSRKQHLLAICALVVSTSVWHDIIPLSFPIALQRGYSLIWFVVLYFVAAYIRKYPVKVKKPILLYTLACLLMFVSYSILELFAIRIPFIESNNLISYYTEYCSTFNLIASVMLFLAFKDITITKGSKLICFISPLTLGIYLIHDNIKFRDYLWNGLFRLGNTSSHLLINAAFAVVIVFFCCMLISYFRSLIFKKIISRKILNRIDDSFNRIMRRVAKAADDNS
jgi:surface polysaccharide O-acyltransferase-like enzyme